MYFEDIAFHATVSVPGVTIEKEKMLAFAHEYDPCPLHVDEAYARSTHFGGLIAPGVMSFMTVWAKYLEQAFSTHEDITKKVHADLELWEETRSHEAALAREAEGYVKAHEDALVEEFPANIML